MKYILFLFSILLTLSSADITASAPKPPLRPSLPIVKPIEKPIVEKNFNYRPNQYYNYNYDPYYDNRNEIAQEKALAEKKEKIEALEKELNATRRAEQKALQKKNKAAYDEAMKKFDNRKSSMPSDNQIIISDAPLK